jgi:hypothetical protein
MADFPCERPSPRPSALTLPPGRRFPFAHLQDFAIALFRADAQTVPPDEIMARQDSSRESGIAVIFSCRGYIFEPG